MLSPLTWNIRGLLFALYGMPPRSRTTDTEAYCRRIAYKGPLTPTLEALRRLQHAHLLSVPFENLDIHRGRRITLDEAALFEKIVSRRQGGSCFELNGLYAGLLRELGFEVRMMSARMALGNGQFGPPFDHLALMAQLEDRWLTDVTLPSDFGEPLRLDERGVQKGAFRIDYDGEN